MSDMTRVALDAMGGDNAPVEMVKGAVEAVQKRNDIQVLLTGKEEILKEELAKYTYPDERGRASAACAADSDAERSFPFDRLRSECRCPTVSSCPVCKDGIYLYGERCR